MERCDSLWAFLGEVSFEGLSKPVFQETLTNDTLNSRMWEETDMSDHGPRLRDLFLNKPECVIRLPEWLLCDKDIEQYRTMSGLAIVEIAGRDSVAAAAKSVEEGSITDLLPTYVYTGTEHGPWASVEEAVHRLAKRLPDVHVHDLVALGSPRFWQALNGRFASELMARYGFYAPCIGCHLYLHSVRIPLAIELGRVPIISGERELHDKAVKINQTGQALTLYRKVAKHFDVELLFPLRHIAEGHRIAEILGFDWKEGEEQLSCVLSKNYRGIDRSVDTARWQIKRYMEEFAQPCAENIIEAYVQGRIPDHLDIAADILGSSDRSQKVSPNQDKP
jgi:hypothetical protein